MTDLIFDVNKLSKILESFDKEPSQTNCYLFFLFFLQRCQLISNILKILDPKIKNSLSISIKYCLLNDVNYEIIFKKMTEFRKEFDKSELINEILKFIKSSVDDKATKLEDLPLVKFDDKKETKSSGYKIKIQSILTKFVSINEIMDQYDKIIGIDDNDIHECLKDKLKMEFRITKLHRDINNINLNWVKNRDNGLYDDNMFYLILKNWFDL